MALGLSSFAIISSDIDNIHEAATFILREQNQFVQTVRVYNDTAGMAPRDFREYGTANFRQASEGEDITPTQFLPSVGTTLTPARYADQFFLTDARIKTDRENVMADAAFELGASAATKVDVDIQTNFSSLTGGTIGSAGGTLTWANLIAGRALMHGLKIPGPYWCALHPYQWNHLVQEAAGTAGGVGAISGAPGFQDALIRGFYVSSLLAGVVFVVSANITVDGSDDATGAMYHSTAIAYDERLPFTLELERDASRQGQELNANMWYATGVPYAARGIQLIGDANTPS